MLSDDEKRALQAMAHDPKVREDFEMLHRAARDLGQRCPLDVYVSFLTCLHQLPAVPPPQKRFPIYSNIRL